MKKQISFITQSLTVAVIVLVGVIMPTAFVFAHESHTYEINGIKYKIVVGSLNEPVIVDDKTGVSFEITRNGRLLENAQQTLEAELIAGDIRKVVELSPVHGEPGQYKSNFIATVPTTLQYRLFGELEGVPFDATYTCNPAGHPRAAENTDRTEISDGVIQTLKTGAFGCPIEKTEAGFPESVESEYQLSTKLAEQENELETVQSNAPASSLMYMSLLMSGLALVIAFRRRSH